jgi:fucose permease
MSVYWGGLAAGRFILGRVVHKFDVALLLRLCILCVIVGSALIWWHPTDMLSFLGLALIGVAEGPIFPSLVSGTSRRVAAGHVDNTIGFEVTAASLGVAAFSSLAGVLAARRSLEIIGPFLVGCTVLMFVLHEIVVRHEKDTIA